MVNPWFWWVPSGDSVAQDYHPLTTWFSPRIDMNFAGDRTIETNVVENVASYGKQLGILIDVVAELVHVQGEDGSVEFKRAAKQLKELKTAVEDVKGRHKTDDEAAARRSLAALKASDEPAWKRIVREEYKSLPAAERK